MSLHLEALPIVNKIKDLPQSIQNIVMEISARRQISPSEMRGILRGAEVKEEDLEPWLDFKHSADDSYGRKMAFDGGFFEIMVMSWNPGDFSAIHDHGFTQWGAVQVFGALEHAAFSLEGNGLRTLERMTLRAGEVLAVSNGLIHQMGNPSESKQMKSLHIYGDFDRHEMITGDARIFDLYTKSIDRVDGGVFYALPKDTIKKSSSGLESDFSSWLRNQVELISRFGRLSPEAKKASGFREEELINIFLSGENRKDLLRDLELEIDDKGHYKNKVYWNVLIRELSAAAELQLELGGRDKNGDGFGTYAEIYDQVIGKPCMESFMQGYLDYFAKTRNTDWKQQRVLSIGCGTGLVEEYMIRELGVNKESLLGLDYSPAMVQEASRRIRAEKGDVLQLEVSGDFDIAFSGLNVFQYLSFEDLEKGIANAAETLKKGGYFLGDFITPDHISWYPNVIKSADEKVISFRTPEIIDREGALYQKSRIINVSFLQGEMHVSDEGEHERILPSVAQVYGLFEKYFEEVELLDALSLEPFHPYEGTCSSKRYVLYARK